MGRPMPNFNIFLWIFIKFLDFFFSFFFSFLLPLAGHWALAMACDRPMVKVCEGWTLPTTGKVSGLPKFIPLLRTRHQRSSNTSIISVLPKFIDLRYRRHCFPLYKPHLHNELIKYIHVGIILISTFFYWLWSRHQPMWTGSLVPVSPSDSSNFFLK